MSYLSSPSCSEPCSGISWPTAEHLQTGALLRVYQTGRFEVHGGSFIFHPAPGYLVVSCDSQSSDPHSLLLCTAAERSASVAPRLSHGNWSQINCIAVVCFACCLVTWILSCLFISSSFWRPSVQRGVLKYFEGDREGIVELHCFFSWYRHTLCLVVILIVVQFGSSVVLLWARSIVWFIDHYVWWFLQFSRQYLSSVNAGADQMPRC